MMASLVEEEKKRKTRKKKRASESGTSIMAIGLMKLLMMTKGLETRYRREVAFNYLAPVKQLMVTQ